MQAQRTRRDFLKTSLTSAAGAGFLASFPSAANGFRGANERPVIAFIGTGIRYGHLMMSSLRYASVAGFCDVDSNQLSAAVRNFQSAYDNADLAPPAVAMCEDYRRILERPDIDAVVVATPDHWHTKIAIEAMRAGKDVYCEKPLTLTIAEGRQILDAIDETGRVCQVGTQQRSGEQFQTAAMLMRSGRVGNAKRVTVGIGDSPVSDALPVLPPPSGLNWNRWLGPAPWTPYRAAPELPGGGYGSQYPFGRGHGHFRWWYEYAGGKITDWGAHHVDIALWALNKSDGASGRFTVDPIEVEHPVEFVDGYPAVDDRFNAATRFSVRVTYEDDGVELDIASSAGDLKFDNGIMFQGDSGRYFVNRGKLTGKPVEELVDNPLSDSDYNDLYPGLKNNGLADDHDGRTVGHIGHFMDCVKTRKTPISDVGSHHRHLTVCHATNLAMRLGRKLTFDTASERFVGDEQANTFLAREPRKGFEIEG